MNTPDLLAFFKGPVAAAIGTVGPSGKPTFLRVLGVTGTLDTRQLRAVFSRAIAGPTLDDLKGNPVVALTVADITTMHSRQFKGKVLAVQDASDAEQAIAEQSIRTAMGPIAMFFGATAAAGWERYYAAPFMTLMLEYSTRFNQTPGPDAGKELA